MQTILTKPISHIRLSECVKVKYCSIPDNGGTGLGGAAGTVLAGIGIDEPEAVPRRALSTPRSIPASTVALIGLMTSPGIGEAVARVVPARQMTGGWLRTDAGVVEVKTVGELGPATSDEDERKKGAATGPLEPNKLTSREVGASAEGAGS
uniref:Uncharacterized protein n=1 Tax=Amphimedon queenslandica TaxID=400682 RepID=A0A1X7USG7_AMPQE